MEVDADRRRRRRRRDERRRRRARGGQRRVGGAASGDGTTSRGAASGVEDGERRCTATRRAEVRGDVRAKIGQPPGVGFCSSREWERKAERKRFK